VYRVLHEEQNSKQVLRILGYRRDPLVPVSRPAQLPVAPVGPVGKTSE
jgi:hypothetical protein